MAIDFTVAPYHDDFNEAKKFLKILFRPGFPVQTRELNQIQSILQNQLSRLGDSFFKDGEVVIPGESFLDTKLAYVKVEAEYESNPVSGYLNDIVGSILTGVTSGVKAKVIKVVQAELTDPITIFVKYENSGSDGSTSSFAALENLASDTSTISGIIRRFKVQATDPTGFGSAAFVNRGVYYVNKTFALVDSQTIILEKYSTTPSYKVGFDVVESFATPNDDDSLNDNATGTLNYEAPGAHRYKLELVLNKYDPEETDPEKIPKNFVEILRVNQGNLVFRTDRTEYSVLEKTLAERTYDESGDYTVRRFPIQIREHRNNDRGAWESGVAYLRGDVTDVDDAGTIKQYVATNSATSGATVPSGTGSSDGGVTWEYTDSPQYNGGLFKDGSESKLAVGIEPGKAYIKGFKIDKIATDYIAVDKARSSAYVNSDSIATNVGSYMLVTGVVGIPDITGFGSVNLHDRLTSGEPDVVGTARIRGFEFESGTIGTTTAIYRLNIFDVQMQEGKSFARDVKRVSHSSPASFVANVSPVIDSATQISGSVTSSGTTVTGFGTRFTQELRVGDYILIGATSVRVESITNDTSLTSGTSLTAAQQVLVYLHIARLEEVNSGLLLFPVGQNFIKTIRAADEATVDSTYYVTQRFVSTASSGNLTINLASALDPTTLGKSFDISATKSRFVVIRNTDGVIVNPTSATVTESSVTFSVTGDVQYTVFAPVFKGDDFAKEKTKTLVTSQVKDFTTVSELNSQMLYLGKADAIRIRSIKMATATGAYSDSGAVDVSDRYTFNDGQTDGYYGVSYLTRNADAPIPTGSVRVVFDYYSHSAGDYFSVNSYPHYNEIPFYASQFGVIPLRDVLDFRPRMNDAGTAFTGGLTQLPKTGYPTVMDYHYYLPRRDKISMNEYGRIIHDQGTSALNPVWPESNKDAMLLYKLSLDAYTQSTKNVSAELIDNKRYTMRDIGKIEKRVDNLEYYTTLSLLEQDTINTEIVDEYGLNRHKAGFIVDAFTGHGVGDTSNPDYRCSVDMENKVLRPYISTNNVGLVDAYTSNSSRADHNYVMTGDVITLPYTTQVIVDQPLASRTENINPFAVYTFVGNVSLTPPSDDWFETARQPDIIKNVEGNFDTIVSNLGGLTRTVWNAWQTQWSGTTDVNIGSATTSRSWVTFNGWTNITSTQRVQSTTTTEQSRTGIQTSVVEKVDREFVEDRTLSTAVVPFIRNRPVVFVARKLKPNTVFTPTFDDVNVSEYITPATRITYDAIAGAGSDFDFTSNVGSLSNEFARLDASENPDVAFVRGDIVYVKTRGATSYTISNCPATAIVAFQETPIVGDKAIHIVNIKGTFQDNDVIEGTISLARVTVNQTVTAKVIGEDLVTNSNGDVVGVFQIPSNDKLSFRTGSRRFRLSDEKPITPSTAGTNYVATGVLETKQATFNAVRNAELISTSVSDSRTITSTAIETRSTVIGRVEELAGGGGGGDPLAQTFTVDSRSGAFLTSVDVFFASRDDSIPVTMEIREVVNGYPGKVVLPFSRKTLTPNQVIANPTNGADATSFVFDSPVYVSGYTEYAIVLLSDSNGYNVWIANMGEQDVTSGNYITSQPTLGVLFKSQNASTWTADQMQDLKFRIHRAKFATDVTGNVTLVNQPTSKVNLVFNPFKTTTGSNKIRVYQTDHGNFVGSKVVLSGVVGTQNGIAAAKLNAEHNVASVAHDSFTIEIDVNANATGFCGGDGIVATTNISFNAIQPQIQMISYANNNVSASARLTAGRSIHPGANELTPLSKFDSNIILNENNFIYNPAIVTRTRVTGNEDLRININLDTDDEFTSPVIDTTRISATLVANVVDKASDADNQSGIDEIDIVSANNIGFTAPSTIYSTDSATRIALKQIAVGKTIAIVNGGEASDNTGVFVVVEVAADGSYLKVAENSISTEAAGNSVHILCQDFFVSELASRGSSSASKYITKKIDLGSESTMLNIRFAASVHPLADIEVWYKTLTSNSNASFDRVNFARADDSGIIKSTSGEFRDINIKVENLPSFTSCAVKLVMKSNSSSNVPLIKDLRIIACT